MATGHAGDDSTESGSGTGHDHEPGREGVGPVGLAWYGLLFGIGVLVLLAGASDAVAVYAGDVYVGAPAIYFPKMALLTCAGSTLVLYGLYGTARTAVQEALN